MALAAGREVAARDVGVLAHRGEDARHLWPNQLLVRDHASTFLNRNQSVGPYRRVVFLLASVDKLLADRGEIDSVTLREKKTLPKRPRTGV